MPYRQPDRRPSDGPLSVQRNPTSGAIEIVSTSYAEAGAPVGEWRQSIVMSEYQASRTLASLALLLGVRIVKEDAAAIKF